MFTCVILYKLKNKHLLTYNITICRQLRPGGDFVADMI